MGELGFGGDVGAGTTVNGEESKAKNDGVS